MTAFIVSFTVWALLHSLTASRRFKTWARRQIGERAYEGLYRLAYNLFAILTILPVLYILWTQVPARVVWRIPAPFHWGAIAIQGIGLIGLLVAVMQTDVWEFAGIRQAINYLSGSERIQPRGELVTGGAYALVRHPLYFFSMLLIWFNPLVTVQTLIMNILFTIYFWAGSRVEERRLADTFGEEYEAYREQVPHLIPLKWPGNLINRETQR
jgi:protein-S-isoprenylcysteine O-methyltransferase Ste14